MSREMFFIPLFDLCKQVRHFAHKQNIILPILTKENVLQSCPTVSPCEIIIRCPYYYYQGSIRERQATICFNWHFFKEKAVHLKFISLATLFLCVLQWQNESVTTEKKKKSVLNLEPSPVPSLVIRNPPKKPQTKIIFPECMPKKISLTVRFPTSTQETQVSNSHQLKKKINKTPFPSKSIEIRSCADITSHSAHVCAFGSQVFVLFLKMFSPGLPAYELSLTAALGDFSFSLQKSALPVS